MAYTTIVAQLAKQREAVDFALAQKAREEYGGDFESEFSYRRGSEVIVMTKPAVIARHYRTLQGLPSVASSQTNKV